MTNACLVLTPAEKQFSDILSQAEKVMMKNVFAALKEAEEHAAAEFRAHELEGLPPAFEYFAAVLHQQMYCVMCGADPETMQGGDPRIAIGVIRNSQNIAKHYWGADIEPYPRDQS